MFIEPRMREVQDNSAVKQLEDFFFLLLLSLLLFRFIPINDNNNMLLRVIVEIWEHGVTAKNLMGR